jgi:MEMO1 family protein
MLTTDRKPAVAGQFYPEDKDKLTQEVKTLLSSAVPRQSKGVRAIISPHAGYVFSGSVAASAFNQIDGEVSYKRVFVIASSHRVSFDYAALYDIGNFEMPYGVVKVDTAFCKSLVEKHPETFSADRDPHLKEHSLEVQLPFLHYTLKTPYSIVPIIIGTSDPAVCKRIASVLKPYLNKENLFVISSDFSHYPEYADAQQVDEITKEAILSNNPLTLLRTLSENSDNNTPHLVTSLCGWTSVLTLMYMTTNNDSLEYRAIKYMNSGDAKYYGEHERVVGYWGIAVSEKEIGDSEFQLTENDKKALLKIASDTIKEYCLNNRKPDLKNYDFSATLKMHCGAFVSLHNHRALRGCIGLITSNQPLYKVIQEMALSACSNDHRFKPVEAEELPDLDIEISVLSPMMRIQSIDEIQLGKHGILIKQNNRSGLFLPQVATETNWTMEEFLGYCSRDKAGLGWDGWKTADIYIFTATVFS